MQSATTYTDSVKEYSPSLKNYAYYLTQNREDANDLLQETLLKAFSHFGKFEPGTNLKGWLYTIMKNTFINNYRRKIKQNTFGDSTEEGFYLNSAAHALGNEAESTFVMDDLNTAICTLPKDLKQAFMMNFDGYKYQEIADHFAIPIGTVKTRIHLARQILKRRLHAYGASYGLLNMAC
jgi:RNA polymerase sigma-70 factor (ECF subfamily)